MKHFLLQLLTDENCDPQPDSELCFIEADDPSVIIESFLHWLKNTGAVSQIGIRHFSFSSDACHEILCRRYLTFQEVVRSLSAVTPEQFEQDDELLENLMIDLNHAIASPHGYYISLDGGAPVLFDHFLRRAEPEKVYYIHDVVLKFYD